MNSKLYKIRINKKYFVLICEKKQKKFLRVHPPGINPRRYFVHVVVLAVSTARVLVREDIFYEYIYSKHLLVQYLR